MIARLTIASAALVALCILFASCGGGDDSEDTTAAADPPAAASVPSGGKSPSTGGATVPRDTTSTEDGTRTASSDDGSTQPVSPAGDGESERTGKRKSRKRSARDVYTAGKETCFIFGIDQIRHEYELPQRSPEAVARFYANLFEKGNPELVAPYFQGCLQGLRQRAERDRRTNER